jgi:hypothetical protein
MEDPNFRPKRTNLQKNLNRSKKKRTSLSRRMMRERHQRELLERRKSRRKTPIRSIMTIPLKNLEITW